MPIPIRQCAGCRERCSIADLIRIALDQSGQVVLDAARRQPGRGVNLHRGCLERALRTRAIGRGLRCGLTADDADRLRTALDAPVG